MLEQPGFWDDVEHSQQVMKELKNLKDTIEEFETLSNQYEDIGTLIEMAEEENDASLVEEIGNELASFEEKFEEFRIDTLLSEEYDANNAIVTIHAGVGGTEACDWAQMLYRMYTRFAEKKGFSVEVLDYLDGEEAGIKSVTFQVNGLHAYGYLKSEKGVHRLVRISPFNAAGKRQTSFAAVDVMPELDDSIHLFPGALRGMGYSSVPMILSVIGTVGMRILWIFVFFPLHRSLYFLFISYPASWLATIIMQVICYYFVRKKCLSAVKNPDLEKIRQ